MSGLTEAVVAYVLLLVFLLLLPKIVEADPSPL